jgi:hypothetical protein
MSPVLVPVSRHVEPLEHVKQAALEKAASIIRKMPISKQSLIKEAAWIPDPAAVDTVLALGFINPGNMTIFVKYLPELEATQSKLCELLIASRLGLREIPSDALERAIKGLEATIEGLNVIAFNSPS